MKVTVVVLNYYRERAENVKIILSGLKSGSYKPSRIILFNNNKDIYCPSMEGVSVINSNTNFGGRARYPVGLLEPSDYYFFTDDDMRVNHNTLKNFVSHAKGDCCLGYRGKIINKDAENKYTDSQTYWGNKIDKPLKVDFLIGAGGMFISFSGLTRMFKTEKKLLGDGYKLWGKEEDIILSMSNKPIVIPAKEDEYLDDLPAYGVGYCEAEGHYGRRDAMVNKLYEWRKI